MDGRCHVHGFELAENHCRNCGLQFCSECLVYAFGSSKPPYCISCALAASGVRSNAGRQTNMSRRDIKRMAKERKNAAKSQRTAAPKVEVHAVSFGDPPPSSSPDNPFAWADDPEAGQRVPF